MKPEPRHPAAVARVAASRPATAGDPLADPLAREVEVFLALRDSALESAKRFGTPQYLLDVGALRAQADGLNRALAGLGQPAAALYAYKANYLPRVLREVTARGFGAEVGGLPELELALAVGAQNITLNGPAMSAGEIDLALKHPGRVLIQIDNAEEIDALAARLGDRGRWPVGVRLRPRRVARTPWSRFGVAVDDLPAFLGALRRARLDLVGMHIHGGPVPEPAHYRALIEEILPPVDAALSAEEKLSLKLINLGGGLVPAGESAPRATATSLPGQAASSTLGGVRYADGAPEPPALAGYIEGLAAAFDWARPRFPWVANVTVAIEPGRFLVAKAMHILMSVYTMKDGMAILDGSTSLVGYDRFGTERFPIINLSRPGGLTPIAAPCYGSLCDPGDFLGDALHGEPPQPGDVLAYLNQGAYTLSYAHRFMRPTARAVALEPDGTLTLEKEIEPLATWLGTPL
jgi:diaminopimelate decarboxylase